MTRHIPSIVMTGELSHDKKHILDRLESHFTQQGYTVAIVPDMATKLLAGNCGPGRIGIVRFHEYVLQLTIDGEREARHELATAEKPLIFVCRGGMDGAAWLDREEIEGVWDREGYTPIHLRDERYHGVLHILADDLRIHADDERTLSAWIGTPHLGCIDHHPSIDERVRQAIAWTTSFLSGVEHEQRWLILPAFNRDRLPANARRIEIQQTYVRLPDEIKDHRYRARGESPTYTLLRAMKRKTGFMSSDDNEVQIDEQTFVSDIVQYRAPGYATVVKDRWCCVGNLHYFEHDVLRDLPFQVVEAEVPDSDWPPIDPPPWFSPEEVVDITGMSGYSNRDFAAMINEQRQAA